MNQELAKAQQAKLVLEAVAAGDVQITHVLPSYKGEVTETTAWKCSIKTTCNAELTFLMEGATISIVEFVSIGDEVLLSSPAPMDAFCWLTCGQKSALTQAVFKALDQVIPD